MTIHPEARELLAKAYQKSGASKGFVAEIKRGGFDSNHHEELAALTEALRKRDEARAEVERLKESLMQLSKLYKQYGKIREGGDLMMSAASLVKELTDEKTKD